jgi:hypothetical protein
VEYASLQDPVAHSLRQRHLKMDSTRLRYSFAPFYNDAARHPELPKFRTLGQQWTKKLFDDTEEVLQKEQAVNDALVEKSGIAIMTVLDCPRSLIRDDPVVYRKWKEYEDSLQTYCKLFTPASSCVWSRG